MQETKQLYEKKGQVGGAIGSTIQLILGVGIAVMVLIFVGVLAGTTFQITETQLQILRNVVGESFTPLNSTGVLLGNNHIIQNTLILANATGVNIGLGNFTINYGTGNLTLTNNQFDSEVLTANYTHGNSTVQNSIRSAAVSGFTALEQVGDYLPLIVLAIVIFLILVLVLGFTALGGIAGGGGGRQGTVL